MTIKKLAIIRQSGNNECPFGLPISEACEHAGDSVGRMALLEHADKEDRPRYANANKRVYIHHRTGERCPYADKIVEGAPVVHCDFGDGGEGLRDSPMRPSPYYPRIFNGMANNAGGGIAGLVAYPLNSYLENMEAQQLFTSMLSMYAARQDVEIIKDSEISEEFLKAFFEKKRGGQ